MAQQKTYAGELLVEIEKLARVDKTGVWVEVVSRIKKAQHFSLPEAGFIFNDGLRGLDGVDSELIRLPYPEITLSFPQKDMKQVVLLWQVGDEIRSTIFIRRPENRDLWGGVPLVFGAKNLRVSGGHVRYEGWVEDVQNSQIRVADSDKPEFGRFMSTYILEFLEALSCKNVAHEPLPKSKVHSLLSRNKNLPDFETRVLVINASKGESAGKPSQGGTHASPRQHLRRGHIRRLESGNIWVNACVVGSEGCIKKEYSVH